MKKCLATITLTGAMLLGCDEKPKIETNFFINPITGKIENKKTPTSKKEFITQKKKPQNQKLKEFKNNQSKIKEIQKESERFDSLTYIKNGIEKKFESDYGSFEIMGEKYRGIIFSNKNEKYGLIRINPVFIGEVEFEICKAKDNKPSTFFKSYRIGQTFRIAQPKKKHLFPEKKFGKEVFYITPYNAKVFDRKNTTQLDVLSMLFLNKKTYKITKKTKEKLDIYADFFMPIKIDEIKH